MSFALVVRFLEPVDRRVPIATVQLRTRDCVLRIRVRNGPALKSLRTENDLYHIRYRCGARNEEHVIPVMRIEYVIYICINI